MLVSFEYLNQQDHCRVEFHDRLPPCTLPKSYLSSHVTWDVIQLSRHRSWFSLRFLEDRGAVNFGSFFGSCKSAVRHQYCTFCYHHVSHTICSIFTFIFITYVLFTHRLCSLVYALDKEEEYCKIWSFHGGDYEEYWPLWCEFILCLIMSVK
jgi:hypothetical protein